MCLSVFVNDTEVILAGTPINTMSVKHKNNEYQRFAEEYDIHFIFEDRVPEIDFYTIPMVDVFARDSAGGYIGSVGQATNLKANTPICYIDGEKNCYLIAKNFREFLDSAYRWKEMLIPYNHVEFFESLEMAQKKYEFLDRTVIEQELEKIE